MPREYRHIKQYENEILRLKSEGLSKVFCIYLLLEICMTIAFNSKKSHLLFKNFNVLHQGYPEIIGSKIAVTVLWYVEKTSLWHIINRFRTDY